MSNISNAAASEEKPERERLGFTTKLAYGAGDMGPALTANVSVFFLLYFFTQVAGLPTGLAGTILMIGKVCDAINDPIVGIMSDRTRTRWGRRLPWMVFGAIPFSILFFLQWIVPRFSDNNAVNNWWLFGYYVLIGILLNIAYTVVNLPYTALTPELTQDYNERTSLNSFRFTFSLGGSILALVLARVIFNAYPGELGKQYLVLGLLSSLLALVPLCWCFLGLQERGAQPILGNSRKKAVGVVLTAIGIITGIYGIAGIMPLTAPLVGATGEVDLAATVALLFAVLITLFGLTLLFSTPESNLSDAASTQERGKGETPVRTNNPYLSLKEQLRIVFSNKPFLYLIGIYLCSWLAVQLTASILPYFVVNWMGLPDAAFPQVALAVQGTAIVMLFVWKAISDRVGKKAVYALGTGFWIIAQTGLLFVQPGQIALMYFLAVLAGVGVSVAYLIPWSMLPDVIDLDELRTEQRREGIFYGFMVLLQKMGLALGLFLVGQVLAWAGFIESIPGEPRPTQPDSAMLAIRIAIAPLPALALVGGLVLAYFYPITREFHSEIRLQLQQRKQRHSILD
ncbi:MAG: MFS transporter [Cyanobacteria bacterium SW_7_48_12]|nr:MAG: MFS transporter [Cyanobacteria bacterium SW_7_48_12]